MSDFCIEPGCFVEVPHCHSGGEVCFPPEDDGDALDGIQIDRPVRFMFKDLCEERDSLRTQLVDARDTSAKHVDEIEKLRHDLAVERAKVAALNEENEILFQRLGNAGYGLTAERAKVAALVEALERFTTGKPRQAGLWQLNLGGPGYVYIGRPQPWLIADKALALAKEGKG